MALDLADVLTLRSVRELADARTIKIDRPQLSPADIKKLQEAMQEKAKAD